MTDPITIFDADTDYLPPLIRSKPPNPNRKPHIVDFYHEPHQQKWIDPGLREEDVNSILLPMAHLRIADPVVIQRLTGWHERKVRYRLLELRKGGYVTRHVRPEFKTVGDSFSDVYHLTPKATYLLRMVFGGSVFDYKPATQQPRYSKADHELELSLFRVCVEQGAQAAQVTVGSWQRGRSIKYTHKSMWFIPDQSFAISSPTHGSNQYFHEHDRSKYTDNINVSWKSRFRHYSRLWLSGRFSTLFNSTRRPIVLVTGLSMQRLNHLQAVRNEVVMPEFVDMFLFALLSDVTTTNSLVAPVWHVVENKPISLGY